MSQQRNVCVNVDIFASVIFMCNLTSNRVLFCLVNDNFGSTL